MPTLPEFVLAAVQPYLQALLLWLSNQVYDRLVAQDHRQLLVKLHNRLDLTPMETACAAYHHASGPGAMPTHATPYLVRALLVGYLFKWSPRQLEQEIRFNILVKWFVGYPIWEPGPDHCTLSRFHAWVCANQHRAFFDQVLRQIDHDFPEERLQPQIGDTFTMQANAARESLIRLLRHTCQCLLRDLKDEHPDAYTQVTANLNPQALFAPKDEKPEAFLDEAARQARLQATVQAVCHLQEQVRPTLAGRPPETLTRVRLRLEDLAKILADEVTLTRDVQGQVIAVHELPLNKKGDYRLGSATDRQATYRQHGDQDSDTTWDYHPQSLHPRDPRRPRRPARPGRRRPLVSAQIKHQDLCPPN